MTAQAVQTVSAAAVPNAPALAARTENPLRIASEFFDF